MRTQVDEDLSDFLALKNGSKPFQAALKTNISIKPVMFLPVSRLCLSVTQESWKESLSYYSSEERSFVLLDSLAHPSLQCTCPEASAMDTTTKVLGSFFRVGMA